MKIFKILIISLMSLTLQAMEPDVMNTDLSLNVPIHDLPSDIQKEIKQWMIAQAYQDGDIEKIQDIKTVSKEFPTITKEMLQKKQVILPKKAATLWESKPLDDVYAKVFKDNVPSAEIAKFSKDGTKIYLGTMHGRFVVLDLDSGNVILSKRIKNASLEAIDVSNDEKRALVGSGGRTKSPEPNYPEISPSDEENDFYNNDNLFLVDTTTGIVKKSYKLPYSRIWQAVFSRDNSKAYVVLLDSDFKKHLIVLDLINGNTILYKKILLAAVNRNGRAIIMTDDVDAEIFDLEKNEFIKKLNPISTIDDLWINNIAISDNGEYGAFGTDQSVTLYNLETDEQNLFDTNSDNMPEQTKALSNDGSVGLSEYNRCIYNTKNGKAIFCHEGEDAKIFMDDAGKKLFGTNSGSERRDNKYISYSTFWDITKDKDNE